MQIKIRQFLFYYSLGQSPALRVRISHLGNRAALFPSADQLLAFSREGRLRLGAAELRVSTQRAFLCATTRLSLLKGKKVSPHYNMAYGCQVLILI